MYITSYVCQTTHNYPILTSSAIERKTVSYLVIYLSQLLNLDDKL